MAAAHRRRAIARSTRAVPASGGMSRWAAAAWSPRSTRWRRRRGSGRSNGADGMGNTANILKEQPGGAAKTLLKSGKHAPHTGQILKNEDLADSISLLRRHGKEAFYKGELAKKIAAWMEKNGGLITEDDL